MPIGNNLYKAMGYTISGSSTARSRKPEPTEREDQELGRKDTCLASDIEYSRSLISSQQMKDTLLNDDLGQPLPIIMEIQQWFGEFLKDITDLTKQFQTRRMFVTSTSRPLSISEVVPLVKLQADIAALVHRLAELEVDAMFKQQEDLAAQVPRLAVLKLVPLKLALPMATEGGRNKACRFLGQSL